MTKLMEWVSALVVAVAVWMAFLFEWVLSDWSRRNATLVLWAPVLAVVIFGAYSAVVVIYRVVTFNDCHEAAEELRAEIDAAKKDLRKKGMKID
jgi:dolichyl-phosphate mannosyltransferase polypeptide 3